jgi:hypothetical protein
MNSQNRIAPFVILFAIAVVLQLAFVAADCRQTPLKVATQFSEDFFYLDADMQDYLCESLAANDQWVNQYLDEKSDEAARRGLSTQNLRRMFTTLHLKTFRQGRDSMQIHIEGNTRVAINPAFMVIGKLFSMGQNYPVEATLDLVKEADGWKICGTPFGRAL